MPNTEKRPLLLAALLLLSWATVSGGDDLQGRLKRAQDLAQSGHPEQAIEIFEEILKEQPKLHVAHLGLGRAYFHAKRYSEAAGSFERARRLRPADLEALEWLGKSYLRAREPQKVIDLFRRESKQTEKSAWSHVLLARAYDAQDKMSEARSELQRALALDPRCREAHFALGFLAWSTRHAAEAEREFRQELALNPQHHLAYYYLSEVLEAQGKLTEAEDVLKQMAHQSADSYFYHFGLGKLEERKGNIKGAAEEFERAIRLDPGQPGAHYRLALVLRKLGQSVQAKEEFELSRRLQVDPRPQTAQGMGLMRPRLPDLD